MPRQANAIANLRPPSSTVINPVNQTISPANTVQNIRVAKMESPNRVDDSFAITAITGGTSF